MSQLNLFDYILKPNGDIELDSVGELKREMDTMDDLPLNYDSADLMTSDFFETVLSLEQGPFNNNIGDGLFNHLDGDFGLSSESSSHGDEVQSTNSASSDSGLWNIRGITDINCVGDNDDEDLSDKELVMSILEPIKSEQKLKIIPAQKPAKVQLNNSITKKIIVTKPFMKPNLKRGNTKTKQLLRVQSGNGRSLLLPLNVANVKSIKILNANDLQTENFKIATSSAQFKKASVDRSYRLSSPDSFDGESSDVGSERGGHYPPLVLLPEEKRLLDKEGIQLPTHYPLTKNEERELKRIRRKIRNKISAQDSRKRKKEYVDGLEERVKRGSEENKFLLKRVKQLQKQNSKLMAQMSKLQALIFNTNATRATPTTCLMIVLFSALLVSLPNLRVSQDGKELGDPQKVAARRALLFTEQATPEEDTLNMEEFLLFNKEEESDLENIFEDNNTEKEYGFSKFIDELGKKFENLPHDKNCSEKDNGALLNFFEACNKYESEIKTTLNDMKNMLEKEGDIRKKEIPKFDGMQNKQGFYEPDIDDFILTEKGITMDVIVNSKDDDAPPAKKMKLNSIKEFRLSENHQKIVPVYDLADNGKEKVVSTTTFALNASKKQ